MFFDSSKKPNSHCNNIYVNVSAHVKDDILDHFKEKLSQS